MFLFLDRHKTVFILGVVAPILSPQPQVLSLGFLHLELGTGNDDTSAQAEEEELQETLFQRGSGFNRRSVTDIDLFRPIDLTLDTWSRGRGRRSCPIPRTILRKRRTSCEENIDP